MAYVAPRSWAIGETPTAALFNQEIRDNLLALRGLNGAACKLYRTTATLSIANGTTRTAVTWQAAAWNLGSMWASGTNVTVPVAGRYLIIVNAPWTNVSGGVRGCGFRINAAAPEFDMQVQLASAIDTCTGMDVVELAANDTVQARVFQTSGSALTLRTSGEGDAFMSVRLVGSGTTAPLWTPPKVWADGQIMSPALFNTYIRDAMLITRNLNGVGAKVWLSKDLSVSDNNRETLTWDSSEWNYGGIWDGGANFIAPVPGWYQVTFNTEWDDNVGTPGSRMIGYRVNDKPPATDMQAAEGNTTSSNQSGGDLVYLNLDDALQFHVFQDSGDSLSVHGGGRNRTRASIDLVAA